MVCRVKNGLAYCLSRISTWQGASPYGVPLGRPVGLLTAAGNSSGVRIVDAGVRLVDAGVRLVDAGVRLVDGGPAS